MDNQWIQGRAAGDHEKEEDMMGTRQGLSATVWLCPETKRWLPVAGIMIDHLECADPSLAALGTTLQLCGLTPPLGAAFQSIHPRGLSP